MDRSAARGEGPDLAGLFPGAAPAESPGRFRLRRSGDWLVGQAAAPAADELEEAARGLYRELLETAAGWHLCRIWNFVPDINGEGPGGLERYRIFCRARSEEFERGFGPGFRDRLPAGSAVGAEAGELTVAFAASRARPEHRENPRQLPAYDYPPDYGPRPPSFCRATVVRGAAGYVFVSGTSAIVGHRSVAPGDSRSQLECTLENLETISEQCGLGPDLAAGRARARHFTVYLRRPEERAALEPVLRQRLLRPGDAVRYCRADICRAELNIEIEATIGGA
ncbi:MAG TPA: hypothetical protein VHC86_12015 [Opitutaceae bacterium]|nr:hypothetical protein [Opitutaceae bacterium]